MCYFSLTYDDIVLFVIFYIKLSWNFVFPTNIKSMLSWYFLTQFLEAVKEFHKYLSQSTTTFEDT